jgi:integrase
MSKFNPKKYMGKRRIERAVSGSPGISKIWVWSEQALQYQPPIRGNAYVATRVRTNGIVKVEQKATFANLDLARGWKNASAVINPVAISKSSPTFGQVTLEYEKNRLPQLRQSTQESYKKMLARYFPPLTGTQMHELTPSVVDAWIDHIKSLPRTVRRKSFVHEYNLFSSIVKFYADKDDTYQLPFRPRHKKALRLSLTSKNLTNKYMSVEDFLKFRDALKDGPNGQLFSAMATVQYFQALRISEVVGLRWTDINWTLGQIYITQSVFFSRSKGIAPKIVNGFKNSQVNGGEKSSPLFKESFDTLQVYQNSKTQSELIFLQNNGELLTYRQIQYAYDCAFRKAKLSFSGTHIMRHGGASHVYNLSNGDHSMVQAITGNKDLRTTLVYSHRDPKALQRLVQKSFEENEDK